MNHIQLFGAYLRKLRAERKLSLREFCLKNGMDPGNYSRLERGMLPPPQSEEALEKYAAAFGLARGSDEWMQLCDLASAARGELPKDLLSDQELVAKLPALFRTLRGNPVSADTLDELVEKVRRS